MRNIFIKNLTMLTLVSMLFYNLRYEGLNGMATLFTALSLTVGFMFFAFPNLSTHLKKSMEAFSKKEQTWILTVSFLLGILIDAMLVSVAFYCSKVVGIDENPAWGIALVVYGTYTCVFDFWLVKIGLLNYKNYQIRA